MGAGRKGSTPWLVMLGLLLYGVSLACVSARLSPADLPPEPIAFLHWPGKSGQKRGEIFANAAEQPSRAPDKEDRERVEELEIRSYLRGDEPLAVRGELAKYPGRVMLLWPRTGELERVDAAPLDSMPIAWSPDRKRLLIASSHRGGRDQLYEYHLERRDLSPVTMGPLEHSRGGYDAQGRLFTHQIERIRSVGSSSNTVHRVGVGGRAGRALADEVPPGTLRVMPEGDQIVYEQVVKRPRRNGPTVYESMIAIRSLSLGSEEEQLIKGREPVLTPDGQWIVFASRSTAGYRLRRMRPDGTSRVPIGPGGTEERMPTLSPDGQFIAFVQMSNGRRRLAARRYDGKDERVLVSSGWCEFPVW